MGFSFAVTFIGLLATYLFAWALLSFTQDVREPPAIATAIPFVSPLIDLARESFSYWKRNGGRWPIYTLRLPFTRLYIVNSTALISAVQRQTRTISFTPILVRMAPTIMGISKEGYRVISTDSLEDDSFVHQTPKIIHPALGPGPALDSLNRRALQILAASLAKTSSGDGPSRLKMYDWISNQVMMATTQAIYGPGNPFQITEIRKAWRKYEKGLIPLMLGAPSLFAHEYLAARESLAKAYEKYYANNGPSDPDASAYIKARYDFGLERGLPTPDIARAEVASSIALIGNTMPATFWLVYHVLSHPAVLEDCRRELSEVVSDEGGMCAVDISRVKSSCPILLSTFQEVMRFHGIGMSARTVLEDTTLDNRFLLKKGAIVLIPAIACHNLASVWGDDVGRFNHKRFLREPGSKGRRHDPVAFRAFGGGSTLCPGRHFAATEILAFASLIILSFNIRPMDGCWTAPTTKHSNLGTAVDQPDHDIDVEVSPRSSKPWVVTISGATNEMRIVAEDIAPTQS